MQEIHKVFNLIILDESGSMSSIKSATIQGFNEVVQTIKGVQEQFPKQEHTITFVTFNGLGVKTHLFNQAVSKLDELNEDSFRPNASTPLYDAIGDGVNRLRPEVDKETKKNVLVTILTDGYENASKEYTGKAIKALIEEMKQHNWTFTYMGADHDVEAVATSISITNTIKFKKSSKGMKDLFTKERSARMKYSGKLSRNEDVQDDYYS
jgi:hypothetical protein